MRPTVWLAHGGVRGHRNTLFAFFETWGGPELTVVSLPNTVIATRLALRRQSVHASVSPDDRFVACGSWNTDDLDVYDLSGGKWVAQLSTRGTTVPLFSPNDNILAAVSGSGLSTWDTTRWQRVRHLPGHPTQSLAFSPNGTWLRCSLTREHVEILDTRTFELALRLELPADQAPTRVKFSPDGHHLAAGANRELLIWDLALLERGLAELALRWPVRD